MAEISTIKPPVDGNEVPAHKFTYSTAEYESYEKEGFQPPLEHERNDFHERRFLSQVDVTKSKIYVTIKTIARLKAMDDSGHWKEYLTYNTEWHGKNSFSEDIYLREHIEGHHWIQTKRIHPSFNPETGKLRAYYEKGQPRFVHTID